MKEIEAFTKKHKVEVFFCLIFIISCLFSFVYSWGFWSILAVSIGAILGVIIPAKIEQFSKSTFQFVFRQETTTQIIIGVAVLILSIFLPVLIFLFIGLHAGKSIFYQSMSMSNH